MDRLWKMFSGWSIWGISFHGSVWKLPAHFIDQWPSQCQSLSYYHPKLKLNEIRRSKKLRKALQLCQDMAVLHNQASVQRRSNLHLYPDSFLSWWRFLHWLLDTFLQLPQMVPSANLSAPTCEAIYPVSPPYTLPLKVSTEPSRHCVNQLINQTHIKYLSCTLPGTSPQENIKKKHILLPQSLSN